MLLEDGDSFPNKGGKAVSRFTVQAYYPDGRFSMACALGKRALELHLMNYEIALNRFVNGNQNVQGRPDLFRTAAVVSGSRATYAPSK